MMCDCILGRGGLSIRAGMCALFVRRVPDARGLGQEEGFSHQSSMRRRVAAPRVVVRGQMLRRETDAGDDQNQILGCGCKQCLFSKLKKKGVLLMLPFED